VRGGAAASAFPQRISTSADAGEAKRRNASHTMTPHAFTLASAALATWLMVRAGTSKKMLSVRAQPRCASCGRKLYRKTCSCTR
jgi:hypothetical protein